MGLHRVGRVWVTEQQRDLCTHSFAYWASQVAQMVKKPHAMRETWIQRPGREDPLQEGVAAHSSILAWRILMDQGAWWSTVHGVTESWTGQWSTLDYETTGAVRHCVSCQGQNGKWDRTFLGREACSSCNRTHSNINLNKSKITSCYMLGSRHMSRWHSHPGGTGREIGREVNGHLKAASSVVTRKSNTGFPFWWAS